MSALTIEGRKERPGRRSSIRLPIIGVVDHEAVTAEIAKEGGAVPFKEQAVGATVDRHVDQGMHGKREGAVARSTNERTSERPDEPAW